MRVLNFYHIGKVIPENAEYMGRAMPHLGLKQSKFANPYKLSKDESRGATIERYRVCGYGSKFVQGKLLFKIFLTWMVKTLYASVNSRTKT